MLEFLKAEANMTCTENGAATYSSTLDPCLDFFATAGGMRREDDSLIIASFIRAYAENPDLAMKLLFYIRDIREGLGERRVFRVILKWLGDNHPSSVVKNIPFVAEYGRFDDLLVLMNTSCEKSVTEYIGNQLAADLEALEYDGEVSLLAKWLPSQNTSSKKTVWLGKRLAEALGMTPAEYRKALTRLRAKIKIIENNLRERDYTFDYEKQTSGSLFKYRRAFVRNDEARYLRFLERVSSGEARLNASVLYPYQIVEACINRQISQTEAKTLDATWRSLPDFTRGERALAVVDNSGSMYAYSSPMPASVALSLGMYFAERNEGAFHNHFITFSESPRLIEIKGGSFVERLHYCESFSEVANTNIQKVFELILKTAVRHGIPQSEMLEKLYIISDMEFDACTVDADLTNFEYARRAFERLGYKLPTIVFWNVASRHDNQPVTKNEQGAVLVSGCSPRIFSYVMSGDVSPEAFMMSVISSPRYSGIVA